MTNKKKKDGVSVIVQKIITFEKKFPPDDVRRACYRYYAEKTQEARIRKAKLKN